MIDLYDWKNNWKAVFMDELEKALRKYCGYSPNFMYFTESDNDNLTSIKMQWKPSANDMLVKHANKKVEKFFSDCEKEFKDLVTDGEYEIDPDLSYEQQLEDYFSEVIDYGLHEPYNPIIYNDIIRLSFKERGLSPDTSGSDLILVILEYLGNSREFDLDFKKFGMSFDTWFDVEDTSMGLDFVHLERGQESRSIEENKVFSIDSKSALNLGNFNNYDDLFEAVNDFSDEELHKIDVNEDLVWNPDYKEVPFKFVIAGCNVTANLILDEDYPDEYNYEFNIECKNGDVYSSSIGGEFDEGASRFASEVCETAGV